MKCWVAEAKERADKKHYSPWRYFEKTGGLITADGSGDSEIFPTKLPDGVTNYVFQDPAAEAKECETAAMWAANRVAERKTDERGASTLVQEGGGGCLVCSSFCANCA